ncbi:MAG: hypothetical protein PHV03_11375, partial [Desulfitobacteriaceae bacterium]|nr:hypothetical protein [Desulfitobacteriaceae bacterium]
TLEGQISSDNLWAWHANLVNIDRRKAIILMNNKTRYSVVIYRPKPKDYARMKDLIQEAITAALRVEGVGEDVITSYFTAGGEIEFSKTADRSTVAKLNRAVRDVEFMQEYLDESSLIQRYISIITGRLIQSAPTGKGFYPVKQMLRCLSLHCNNCEDVLDVELYQMKIHLKLEEWDIWRRVLVPSTYSFRHLHNIIQIVFDWHNYHLHEFYAYKQGAKTKHILMDDDPETLQWIDFDARDVGQERFIALKDIFPVYDNVEYVYDFGDGWQHTITVEKAIRSKEFKAIYLDGNGERPPEDVGGAGGYQEYKDIMADEKHPEHESMKAWAQTQKERELSPEQINKELRQSISGYTYHYWPHVF